MDKKLIVGKIPYLNLFPIFYVLEGSGSHAPIAAASYEFIEGHPSSLNRMLRQAEIDVSPSSSIEYLRDREGYIYIDGHSISSEGPVESILIFSRMPLNDLGGKEVFVTHHSETSPILLDIILKKFYGIGARLKITDAPVKDAITSHSAYLSIGDEALLAKSRSHKISLDIQNHDYELCAIEHQLFYIYDLGALWLKHTSLPFVFALWTARKDSAEAKKELFEKFKNDLDSAKHNAMEHLKDIASASQLSAIISPDRIASYWRKISYDLNEKHKKGLELFRAYAEELGLL